MQERANSAYGLKLWPQPGPTGAMEQDQQHRIVPPEARKLAFSIPQQPVPDYELPLGGEVPSPG